MPEPMLRLQGAERKDPCPHCDGTGKQEHKCKAEELVEVEEIYSHGEGTYYSSGMHIKVCVRCGQLWKIRYQANAGTGDDTIWLKPGQSESGYEFSMSEARSILKSREKRSARSRKPWRA